MLRLRQLLAKFRHLGDKSNKIFQKVGSFAWVGEIFAKVYTVPLKHAQFLRNILLP